MPVPPFTIPAGQRVVWAVPSNVTSGPDELYPGATGGSVSANLTSATINMTHADSLGNDLWAAAWSGFTMPTLPPNAVIQSVYPVVTLRGVALLSFPGTTDSFAGNSVDPYKATGHGGISLSLPGGGSGPSAQNFSGQYSLPYTAQGLGNTTAAVTGCTLATRLTCSLTAGFNQYLYVDYIGLAIYYTAPVVMGTIATINVGCSRFLK